MNNVNPALTMREIRMQQYRPPGVDLRTIEGKAFAGAMKYIDHLAMMVCEDVSNWKPLEVFMVDGSLVTEPTAINKKFFEWKGKETTRLQPTAEVSNVHLHNIGQIADYLRYGKPEEAQETKREKLLDADRFYFSYEKTMSEAHSISTMLRLLDNKKDQNIVDSISRLVRQGNYQISEIKSKYIRLITKDVVLRYYHSEQARDFTTCLGQFFVTYSFADLTPMLKVSPAKNNLFSESLFHPHVDDRGNVCFGSLRSRAIKAIAEFDIYNTFHLTWSVLASYNDENPYDILENFSEGEPCGEEEEEQESEGWEHDEDPDL